MVGEDGALSLTVLKQDEEAARDFELSHDQELHLIVVRDDGAHSRHVHPERDASGEWSIPWMWDAAGSHRVFADFVPTAMGEDVTLLSTVQVAGDLEPQAPTGEVTMDQADGFEVKLDGHLAAGESSMLTASVSRDGEPVATLEPYLGAYGHLVALRQGDPAYLHVHPHGEEPEPGQTSGPEVAFEARSSRSTLTSLNGHALVDQILLDPLPIFR